MVDEVDQNSFLNTLSLMSFAFTCDCDSLDRGLRRMDFFKSSSDRLNFLSERVSAYEPVG